MALKALVAAPITMFMNCLDGFQHVPPIELPLQGVDDLALAKPGVEVKVPTLHQHVDVAVCDLTARKRRQGGKHGTQ